MNAKWLFNLKGINYLYLASAVVLNLLWTMSAGYAVLTLFQQQVQTGSQIVPLILMAAAFIGPFLVGWVIGRLADDYRGPTYGMYGSFGSVGVLVVVALPAGLVGLMMIVMAISGGLNGGMASVKRR